MSHKTTLLFAVLALSSGLYAQRNVSFIGQINADSTFNGAMVQVSLDGRIRQHVPIPSTGRFTVLIPEETVAELVIFSKTHLKESLIVDTHHAFCDPVTTPINEKFSMSFALFPRSIAGDIAFNKPYGSVFFVEGTGRRVFEHNMIEVEPSSFGDYAEQLNNR